MACLSQSKRQKLKVTIRAIVYGLGLLSELVSLRKCHWKMTHHWAWFLSSNFISGGFPSKTYTGLIPFLQRWYLKQIMTKDHMMLKWWNTEFQIPKKTAWDSLSLGLHKFDGSSQHPNDVGCNLSICTWLSSETTLPEGWQGWPRLALLIGEIVVPGCIVKAVSRFHIITRSGARSRAILSDHNEELVQTP